MPAPRIENTSPSIYEPPEFMADSGPSISSGSAPPPTADLWDDLTDAASEFTDDVVDLHDGAVASTADAIAWVAGEPGPAALDAADAMNAAADFVTGALDNEARVQALEPGQTAVLEAGFGVSIHKAAGVAASAKASMMVSRLDAENYEAKVELQNEGAAGLGVELVGEGVAVDLSRGAAVRMVVRGAGPDARDALAEVADLTDPRAAADALMNSPHLDVVRLENKNSVGIAASAGAGIKAGLANTASVWSGVDMKNGASAGLFERTELARTFSVSTPRVQLATSEAEVALISKMPDSFAGPQVPEQVLTFFAKHGVSPGVSLKAEGGVAVETRVDAEGQVAVDVELKVQVRAGGQRFDITYSAKGLQDIDADELAAICEAESISEFVRRLEATGAKVEAKIEVTRFEGADIDLPLFHMRNGTETSSTLWNLLGELH